MTVLEAGITEGAVYTPAVLIVPTVVDPPVVPLTDHVTAEFVVPVTVLENASELPSRTVAVDGETDTTTGVALT